MPKSSINAHFYKVIHTFYPIARQSSFCSSANISECKGSAFNCAFKEKGYGFFLCFIKV